MRSREIVVFVLVVLAVFLGGLSLVGLFWWLGTMGYGMMGPGMMGPGMMGRFNPFGWLICLIPLLLILILVGGLVWLIVDRGRANRTTLAKCPNCQRPVLPDWRVCPYCSASLEAGKVS